MTGPTSIEASVPFSLQDDGNVYKGLTFITDFNFFEGDTISFPGIGAAAFVDRFEFQGGFLMGLGGISHTLGI